jgi:transcriptional regulator with XRE-family HTH domain
MPNVHGYLKALLANLTALRQAAGISEQEMERKLILGPGWIRRFETGASTPSIDMLLAILHESGASLEDLLERLPDPEPAEVDRYIFAETNGKDLIVNFCYSKYDAQYTLPGGTLGQFERVLKRLRDGLAQLLVANVDAEAIKTEAVSSAFLHSVREWPSINPSDLWWFIIYRAYCDPYNHPAAFARLDFTQSWKRTGGWALEKILVDHYAPFLKQNGINLYIAAKEEKSALIKRAKIRGRIEADKIDVVLTGDTASGPIFFGAVHVKASFAERRTDDVPLSSALKDAGYTTPLWTMDCKSGPGIKPVNYGELGSVEGTRSAKRRDIEDDGLFTGCFSYNANTIPSPIALPEDRRIYVCNFSNSCDTFSRFIISRWSVFRSESKS